MIDPFVLIVLGAAVLGVALLVLKAGGAPKGYEWLEKTDSELLDMNDTGRKGWFCKTSDIHEGKVDVGMKEYGPFGKYHVFRRVPAGTMVTVPPDRTGTGVSLHIMTQGGDGKTRLADEVGNAQATVNKKLREEISNSEASQQFMKATLEAEKREGFSRDTKNAAAFLKATSAKRKSLDDDEDEEDYGGR